MDDRRRGIIAGSAVAVLLLTAGCGSSSDRTAPAGNSVKDAGAGSALGSAKDSGYGSGSGSGYGSADGYGGSGSGSTPEPAAGSGYGEGGAAAGGPAGRLTTRALPQLGTVATDGGGRTLYRFDKDSASPPRSACDGDCAEAWPPVPAADATAAAGVDASLLGEVLRADGSRQLTLGGWPVYRYAKDDKPGDANGEGVGGTWHALAPDGKKAVDKKAAGTSDGSMPGGSMSGGGMKMGGGKADGAELSVFRDAELGNLVAEASGMTLYRFDKDSAWPMKIGCVGACTNTWKPAAPVDRAKVKGIAQKLIGSVLRPDGSRQLTINCWPVYWFTGDEKPGDTNGQGKQGLWFAVTDTGKKAGAAG
ncbi:SCO0930 family lipoprotein [Streptomyces sp. NPDC089919]|uniref:SCO0930 family lipoprotein n=1 Tax=Streptomyces sp. NPDC089919 TaxID=3155188 RepID=UPI003417E6FA